jgi:hypothetical protein
MLVSGPAIVAFVNSVGGGHCDRLIERFAVAAMSDAQLLMMNPDELQDALYASFLAYAMDQGMTTVADTALTRRCKHIVHVVCS